MDAGSAPGPAHGEGIATMPSVYSSGVPPPETPHTDSSSPGIVDFEFIRGIDGILQGVEMIFSLITFICATVHYEFVPLGGGWVQFVSMTAFILTGFLYMLHAFKMTPKLSEKMPFKFTEFCYDATFTLFYFIAGVVSAARGGIHGAVVAAAVFSFFNMLVYGADSYFRFMSWRHSSEGPYFSSTLSGVTASSSSNDRPQY